MDIQQVLDKEFCTTKQAAKVAGLEAETMRQYIYSGRYPYEVIRFGRTPMLRKSDVAKWKKQRK
jgi:excisionase family DNA binding protein